MLSRPRTALFSACENVRKPLYVPSAWFRAVLNPDGMSGTSPSGASCALIGAAMSSPAENARPVPVKTTTRTVSSICACAIVSMRSRFIGIVMLILVVGAFGIGGSSAWVVFAVVALIGAGYAHVVWEFRRIATRPPAKLNWWQRGFWNLLLAYYRLRKWQPGSPGVVWKVLDMRRKPFDDRYITSIPYLTSYHVLDLEGRKTAA